MGGVFLISGSVGTMGYACSRCLRRRGAQGDAIVRGCEHPSSPPSLTEAISEFRLGSLGEYGIYLRAMNQRREAILRHWISRHRRQASLHQVHTRALGRRREAFLRYWINVHRHLTNINRVYIRALQRRRTSFIRSWVDTHRQRAAIKAMTERILHRRRETCLRTWVQAHRRRAAIDRLKRRYEGVRLARGVARRWRPYRARQVIRQHKMGVLAGLLLRRGKEVLHQAVILWLAKVQHGKVVNAIPACVLERKIKGLCHRRQAQAAISTWMGVTIARDSIKALLSRVSKEIESIEELKRHHLKPPTSPRTTTAREPKRARQHGDAVARDETPLWTYVPAQPIPDAPKSHGAASPSDPRGAPSTTTNATTVKLGGTIMTTTTSRIGGKKLQVITSGPARQRPPQRACLPPSAPPPNNDTTTSLSATPSHRPRPNPPPPPPTTTEGVFFRYFPAEPAPNVSRGPAATRTSKLRGPPPSPSSARGGGIMMTQAADTGSRSSKIPAVHLPTPSASLLAMPTTTTGQRGMRPAVPAVPPTRTRKQLDNISTSSMPRAQASTSSSPKTTTCIGGGASESASASNLILGQPVWRVVKDKQHHMVPPPPFPPSPSPPPPVVGTVMRVVGWTCHERAQA